MAHTARLLLTVLSLVVLISCESGPQGEVEPGEAHVAPAETTMHDIMQAKLSHTHALLEGIALQNYHQIELNSMALTALSEESDWQVHDTLTYGVLSDEFRGITGNLMKAAREQDGGAVRDDYVRMIQSCMKCHTYLREEGLWRDLPGAVSVVGEGTEGERH